MDNFKKLNLIIGWVIFIIASAVYFLTLEPTASWWDCGEYIATAYKLQVGHPPGAPFFQLLGRFFSLFAFGDTTKVAVMINRMSALSSGATIMFLFWTITILAKKLYVKSKEDKLTTGQGWAILGAGIVGSLAYTFTDSFWFSAVEGEVYAMSSLFTAITFWAILRWEEVADERHGYRWILLISYLIGISIGVHLLNLLAIPAIVYVYYFKKYKVTTKGFIVTGILSVVILALIMYIVIPYTVNLAGKFELFFVNVIGLPFNSGTIIYFILLIGALVYGIRYSRKKVKPVLNTILLALVFILIGYSSFFILIIRANADPPINENDPKDAISMLSYLNREQYGTYPLLYGQYYNAPVVGHKDGTPVYIKDTKKGKYVIKDDRKGTIPVYDPRFMTIFPRMWSNQKPGHIKYYKQYGGIKGIPIRVNKPDGTSEILYRPTFGENLRFFFTYQVNHMYIRYFMWNFVGRQNNIESQGEIDHGNWISGIPFIDNARLGDQSNLPPSMQNPARTRFYFLPLLLGLLGFFFQYQKSKKDTWIVFLLFFMTGFAIVIYLNQPPLQPRERDYAYAGSFYAFAIWIGFGALSLWETAKKYLKNEKIAAVVVTLVSLILVPGIMAKEGWKSHDRSGKYAARDFAVMYLESCEPDAILFTNGDNDTFPLWYAQEVEGVRTDVRVVNYMLASGDWYTSQMARKVYNSDPLPLTISAAKYKRGEQNYIPVLDRYKRAELKDAIGFVNSDDKRTKVQLQNGEWINFFPTKNLVLTIDKKAAIKSGTVAEKDSSKIVDQISWKIKQSGLFRNDLLLLDLVATDNWQRPIYFANVNSVSKVLNVDKYCHMEGVVYRFKPAKASDYIPRVGGVDPERSWKVLMNDKVRWGRLNEPDVTVDRESYRNASMGKQSYLRLAQALANEQKYDSAVQALDKGLYFFPYDKFIFDYYTLPWAEIYYQCKATDKANDVMKKIVQRYKDDLDYYLSLDDKFMSYYSSDIQEAMAVLQRAAQIAKRNGQTELAKEFEKDFQDRIIITK
jgi:tetratricopeptide (TPR) repeat protein